MNYQETLYRLWYLIDKRQDQSANLTKWERIEYDKLRQWYADNHAET